MSVKVTSRTAEVLMEVNTKTNVALRLALEDIHRNSNSITPMKTGDLRTKVSKSVINMPRSLLRKQCKTFQIF